MFVRITFVKLRIEATVKLIPPPEVTPVAFPFWLVTLLISTVTPGVVTMWNTLSVPVAGAAFAWMIVVPDPAPLMVIADVIS